jgi:hypothetical protein
MQKLWSTHNCAKALDNFKKFDYGSAEQETWRELGKKYDELNMMGSSFCQN